MSQKAKFNQMKFNEKPVHWPTLNTVLMVEETLKNMDESVITIAELKRKLPRQVNHNTLMIILEYLEKSGKILSGIRGISWVYTDSKILREWVKKGTEI